MISAMLGGIRAPVVPAAAESSPAPDRQPGVLLASGTTVQVMYDYSAGQSIPIPEHLRARLAG